MITVHLIVTEIGILNTEQNSIYTNITTVHRPASYYSDDYQNYPICFGQKLFKIACRTV